MDFSLPGLGRTEVLSLLPFALCLLIPSCPPDTADAEPGVSDEEALWTVGERTFRESERWCIRLIDSVDVLPSMVALKTRALPREDLLREMCDHRDDGAYLARELLQTADPAIQELGLDYLHVADTASLLVDEDLLATLGHFLRAAPSIRLQEEVLWVLSRPPELAALKTDVLRIAWDPGDAALARTAAATYASYAEYGENPETDLTALFHSDTPVLREQAALRLAELCSFGKCDQETLAEPLRSSVVDELIAIMRDSTRPPWIRAYSIGALRDYVDDEAALLSLVDMLRPANWFFGVPDSHEPGWSMERVVYTLADSASDPRVSDALRELQGELNTLEPRHREAIETAIEFALE